jgi:hypothetical protein
MKNRGMENERTEKEEKRKRKREETEQRSQSSPCCHFSCKLIATIPGRGPRYDSKKRKWKNEKRGMKKKSIN